MRYQRLLWYLALFSFFLIASSGVGQEQDRESDIWVELGGAEKDIEEIEKWLQETQEVADLDKKDIAKDLEQFEEATKPILEGIKDTPESEWTEAQRRAVELDHRINRIRNHLGIDKQEAERLSDIKKLLRQGEADAWRQLKRAKAKGEDAVGLGKIEDALGTAGMVFQGSGLYEILPGRLKETEFFSSPRMSEERALPEPYYSPYILRQRIQGLPPDVWNKLYGTYIGQESVSSIKKKLASQKKKLKTLEQKARQSEQKKNENERKAEREKEQAEKTLRVAANLQKKANGLAMQIDALAKRLAPLIDTYNAVVEDVNYLAQQSSSAQNAVNSAQADLRYREGQLASSARTSRPSAADMRRHERIARQVRQARSRLQSARAYFNNVDAQYQAKRSELRSVEAAIRPLETKKNSLQRQHKKLQAQIKRLESTASKHLKAAEERSKAAKAFEAQFKEAIFHMQRVLNYHLRPLKKRARLIYRRTKDLMEKK